MLNTTLHCNSIVTQWAVTCAMNITLHCKHCNLSLTAVPLSHDNVLWHGTPARKSIMCTCQAHVILLNYGRNRNAVIMRYSHKVVYTRAVSANDVTLHKQIGTQMLDEVKHRVDLKPAKHFMPKLCWRQFLPHSWWRGVCFATDELQT